MSRHLSTELALNYFILRDKRNAESFQSRQLGRRMPPLESLECPTWQLTCTQRAATNRDVYGGASLT